MTTCFYEHIQDDILAIQSLYGFEREFVGVTFLAEEEYHSCDSAPQLQHPLSYCSIVRLACTGHGRKISKNTISCPGALRALGFTPPDANFRSGARYHSLGMYHDQDVARGVASKVSRMRSPVHGLSVLPLRDCPKPPDVVITICNAMQAMRLVQGYAHHHGKPIESGIFGMQGLCAELTVKPFLSGEPVISMLCSNTRYSCAWQDAELGVGLPFHLFHDVVRGTLQTLDAAESDQCKQGMLARADASCACPPITLGNAYYLRDPLLSRTSKTRDSTQGENT